MMTLLPAFGLMADVSVPAIFSNHAVLQKSDATAVFGKADPGEKVSVAYGNAKTETVAGKDGKWLVRLDLAKDDGKSKTLTISGKNTLTINDVITGDVWLAAGQSNMEFQLKKSLDSAKDIANSANDRLRTFKAARTGSLDPEDGKLSGYWVSASPRSAGSFSAVGYYFGRKINAETGNAVGLVDPAWGSSTIQTWMSRETLFEKSGKEIADDSRQRIADYTSYDKICADYTRRFNQWAKECGRSDDQVKSSAPPADAKWTLRKNIFGGIRPAGIFWFRKSVNISKKDFNKGYVFFTIGCPSAAVDFYLDGKLVKSFSFSEAKSGKFFRVGIPEKNIAPGKHEMTLRVHNANPVFSFGRYFNAGRDRNNNTNWEMCVEKKYPALTKKQIASYPKAISKKPLIQKVPTMMWNAMMIPMLPYTMKGAIWYQGEANSGAGRFLYTGLQRAFIDQLRREFGNPEFAFYTVQLTAYKKKVSRPQRCRNLV